MTKKYTLETIKDLKIKVKNLNGSLLDYYTQTQFASSNEFQLITEECQIGSFESSIVNQMMEALENNETEFEAGKILFEHLIHLTPLQASDIGYWTYQNHNAFYPYIAKRWGDLWNSAKNPSPSNYIINHWIQSNSSQQELIKYPISGLWWSFYLTVDDNRENKYELTKLFFKNYSLRVIQMGQTRFARHKPAVLGVLEFIKENNLEEKSLEEAARAIVPYVNLLGGIRPLSYFDKIWFKEKLQSRFGDQIKKGEKLFYRPRENKTTANENLAHQESSKVEDFDCYFCLNAASGNYKITEKPSNDFTYCIGIDFNIDNQFLTHFYKEGKIKKSLVNGNISNKTIDRVKPYSNGKCPKLTLLSLELIVNPVLFGIAYKTRHGTFFKAMDEQNGDWFRVDNGNLRQEGKKVLYIDDEFDVMFKILPYELIEPLGTLIQGPLGKGADITNQYYSDRWKVLKQYWPELFV